MRTLLAAALLTSVVLLPAGARPNAPAPWYACDGKRDGDRCDLYGGGAGRCVRQSDCESQASDVDECLWCEATGGDQRGCASCDAAPGAGAASAVAWTSLFAALAWAWLRRRLRAHTRSG